MTHLLQEGVTAQARLRPDATAIVSRTERVTYGEIEADSNRLAQLLVDAGCRRGDRIALFMPKVPAAIVGMLGVLKADATCVPLDPGDPTTRLAWTLTAADCQWILCAGSVAGALRAALAEARSRNEPLIGWVDDNETAAERAGAVFVRDDLAAFSETAPPSDNGPADVAQILFTTSPNGAPKGVMITHGGVADFVEWGREYFGISADDRVSQHSALRFDLSTFDIFGTLWSGAELHLVPRDLNLQPHKLAHFIRDHRLTQWFSVPSILNTMAKFDVLRERDFPALRRVLFAGEVLPTPTLVYWMRRLPQVRFTNLYGPTETTISSSYHTIAACPSSPMEPIPIGTACAGEELLLLDQHMSPVADGEIGEIYIRGVGVSAGYWRDPDNTRIAFVPDPAGSGRMYKTGDLGRRGTDRLYYFCGRADARIESCGRRVELSEIETALNALPDLREAVVVGIASRSLEESLVCCAYAAEPDSGLTTTTLQQTLQERLPAHMVPARWLHYERLPKDDKGKLDRPMIRRAFESLEVRSAAQPKRVDGGSDGSLPRFPAQRADRLTRGTRVET